jgi:hypothetical protein
MRVLPTSRRVGRLNPKPAAQIGAARLLGRQWWYGGTGVAGASLEFSPVVPGGTRWCAVRLLGPGGRAAVDPGDSLTAWLGAGGTFVRRLVPLRPGQQLSLTVGGQGSAPAEPFDTVMVVDGAVICRAAGGGHASVGAHGVPAAESASIGDVIRPGGPGWETAYYGGRAGSDLDDPDSLGLGGVRRQARNLPVPEPFAGQLVVADYGAGGVAGANGDTEFHWWPPAPSGGSNQAGGPGQAVLEFYDRRPY